MTLYGSYQNVSLDNHAWMKAIIHTTVLVTMELACILAHISADMGAKCPPNHNQDKPLVLSDKWLKMFQALLPSIVHN